MDTNKQYLIDELEADILYIMTVLDKKIDQAVSLGFDWNTQTANQLQKAFSAVAKAKRAILTERN